MSERTLVTELDKLVEDSNIYNKEQAKTQKELNEENEVLRNCIESELEDVTVEGTEITVDDAAEYKGTLIFNGNTIINDSIIETVTGVCSVVHKSRNIYKYVGWNREIVKVYRDKYILRGRTANTWYSMGVGTNPFKLKSNTKYRLTIYSKGFCPSLKFTINLNGTKTGAWIKTTSNTGTVVFTTPNVINSTNILFEGLVTSMAYDSVLFVQLEENTGVQHNYQAPFEREIVINLKSIFMANINRNYDRFLKENNIWKIPNKIQKIDSYNGESIKTPYISSTGGLDIGATVFYVGTTDYIIEDEELIEQLEELQEITTLYEYNNISVECEGVKPVMELSYKKSNAIKFQKEIDELKAMVLDNS